MSQKTNTKILIIGSGAAGLTAAIYAARAALNPLLISGFEEGGQLTTTNEVENFPGFSEKISGPWLMEQMKQQAVNVGTNLNNNLFSRIKEKLFEYSILKILYSNNILTLYPLINITNTYILDI